MKILYVITGLCGGGAEKVVCDLADRMYILGHSVKIVYLKDKKIIVRPSFNDIELIYLGFESILNILSASLKYREIIENFQPDIVHSHMVHANIFSRLNRLFKKIPKLISTAHSSNEGGRMRMLAYQLTDSLADTNTNVSKIARNEFILKKAFTEKSLYIYNGIDLSKFKYHKKNNIGSNLNMIAIGRLNYVKDFPNLIHAIKIIKNKGYTNFSLSIVGDGEEKENLKNLINDLDLSNFIKLLGRRDDIPELLNNSDIFILSSLFEGFGLVVAEAMATNNFVISTDCGGVKEVMGNTGLLVPIQNSKKLAQAIISVMEMPKEEIELNNQKAYQYIKKNFDLELIAQNWISLYEK